MRQLNIMSEIVTHRGQVLYNLGGFDVLNVEASFSLLMQILFQVVLSKEHQDHSCMNFVLPIAGSLLHLSVSKKRDQTIRSCEFLLSYYDLCYF